MKKPWWYTDPHDLLWLAGVVLFVVLVVYVFALMLFPETFSVTTHE